MNLTQGNVTSGTTENFNDLKLFQLLWVIETYLYFNNIY